MSWPWHRGQRSLKVIGTHTYRSATSDFLLTFHSNLWPISHRFRDRRQFQSKIANFSHPVYFAPPPLNGYRRWGQQLEWWGYQAQQEVQHLQPCGYNPPTWRTDKQTDRRTDTGRQQRSCLRIASRG